jgi:hypothetical protein
MNYLGNIPDSVRALAESITYSGQRFVTVGLDDDYWLFEWRQFLVPPELPCELTNEDLPNLLFPIVMRLVPARG